jgi:hypothetical protein
MARRLVNTPTSTTFLLRTYFGTMVDCFTQHSHF